MKAFLKSPNGIFALRPKITTIGRHDDSDIVLKSLGVEDHHAAIECSDSENTVILRDFNTVHGSFVNDCHIQNAAVKVSPGDVLRFGVGGANFELVVETTSQISCPPVIRRNAWPGQLQLVTEAKISPTAASQFPFLQAQQSPPVTRSWAHGATTGTSPRPPLRKRPINAWGRTVSSPSFSPDAFIRAPAVTTGNGAAVSPVTNTHNADTLLKEKEELISKMETEIGRLSSYESESKHKDSVIANLQAEIADMMENMIAALAQKDAEFNQKLLILEQDIKAKTDEIHTLKEQVDNLQSNASEVLYHSLSERDLQITHWKQESEKLKKNNSLTTGLVTSLQKDITSKEQTIQQLKVDAEKLRQESREKDSQLAHISAQCSRIKDETKREVRGKEINPYRKHIGELELQVRRSKEEIQKCYTELRTLSSRLAERTKAEADLKKDCERRSKQLQEMGRRERLLKADMELAGSQAQHFRNQIVEVLFSQLTEKCVTDQQIVEKMRQIQETNKEICQREKSLRDDICLKISERKEIFENVELLKKSLDGLQAFLKTPYGGNSLRKEICNFRNVCLAPPASWIRTSAAEVLLCLLSWVDAVENLLRDTGLGVSAFDTGMDSYMKKLLDNHCSTTGRIQTLQTQLRKVEESQRCLLEEKLTNLKVKLLEEFQDKERALLEEERKNQTILQERAALEKGKLEEALEGEMKKVQDLAIQVTLLSEAIERKTKLEEDLNTRLRETLEELEMAKTGKTVAEEKLTSWEKHLKSTENEKEMQTRKYQEEITEYKEHVKQHSWTIVDLERKLSATAQQLQKMQGDNVKLQKQIEEMQIKSYKPLPPSLPQKTCAERSHLVMVDELATAQRDALSSHSIVLELKKELSETKARMSDMIGELSEKQKVELEQKRSLARRQAHDLSQLREKLCEMSRLMSQKDTELKKTNEELRNIQDRLRELKTDVEEKAREPQKILLHKSVQTSAVAPQETPAAQKTSSLDLADLGAKCKGSRHEETIQRQKDAVAELRERVKLLEKSPSLGLKEKTPESLIVLKKDLTEMRDRKAERERVSSQAMATDANKLLNGVSSKDPNVAIERTARLEMADALDLSENMYFNLIQDLASLMNVTELAGMRTVKHLRPDEREKVGMQRQKDLELLFGKISKLKNRLERKDGLLKEYERDVGKFRTNQQSLQACQAEMAKLAEQIYQASQENALLKEGLERTTFQLTQEKRLNKSLKQYQTAAKKRVS